MSYVELENELTEKSMMLAKIVRKRMNKLNIPGLDVKGRGYFVRAFTDALGSADECLCVELENGTSVSLDNPDYMHTASTDERCVFIGNIESIYEILESAEGEKTALLTAKILIADEYIEKFHGVTE